MQFEMIVKQLGEQEKILAGMMKMRTVMTGMEGNTMMNWQSRPG